MTDKPIQVFTVNIYREDATVETLSLCKECIPSIIDFARIITIKPADGDCDRCGKESP